MPASSKFTATGVLALAALLTPGPLLLAQSSAEFDAVLARYGQINTIAGSGTLDNCNDWLPGNEGGPATAADLSRPHIAQADAAGNVYIADKEAYAIRMVDLAGRIHTVAGNGTFGEPATPVSATATSLWAPNGLCVLPDGTLYFLTLNDNCAAGTILPGGRIHKLAPDGTLTTIIEDSTLFTGRGLHVSPDETTIHYCSGNALRRWTNSTGSVDLANGFVQLGNIAREPSGSFLVTDRGTHLVWRVHPDGSMTVVAGNGGTSGGGHGQLATATGLNEVRGVAVLDTGGYFLCTHRDDQVWYVDSDGYIWLFLDGAGDVHAGDGLPVSSPGLKISEPRAVTLAPNGDLLVTEHDSGYIRRITNITVPPRITALHHDPATGMHLTWTSHREATYHLRTTSDFLTWSESPAVPASDGTTTSYLDSALADAPDRFYQVIQTD